MRKKMFIIAGICVWSCLYGCGGDKKVAEGRYKSVEEYVESASKKNDATAFTDSEEEKTENVSSEEENSEEPIVVWEGGPDEEFPLDKLLFCKLNDAPFFTLFNAKTAYFIEKDSH